MDGTDGKNGEKKDGDESDGEILRTDPGTNWTTPAIPDPSIEMQLLNKMHDLKKFSPVFAVSPVSSDRIIFGMDTTVGILGRKKLEIC